MMFGFMAVLFGQLGVTTQAAEVNVIYDKAYQSQTDVKAFFRARAMGTIIQPRSLRRTSLPSSGLPIGFPTRSRGMKICSPFISPVP